MASPRAKMKWQTCYSTIFLVFYKVYAILAVAPTFEQHLIRIRLSQHVSISVPLHSNDFGSIFKTKKNTSLSTSAAHESLLQAVFLIENHHYIVSSQSVKLLHWIKTKTVCRIMCFYREII